MIKNLISSTVYRLLLFSLLAVVSTCVNGYAQTTMSVINTGTELTSQLEPYRSEFFRVGNNPTINVNTISGDIEVVQNPGIEGVQVDLFVKREFSLWSGTRNLDNFRIIIQKQGNTVIASVEDRRSGRSQRTSGDVQFTFQVQVPSKASLNLRTINGTIYADGVEGQHYIQNHAGNLDIRNLTGEVRAISTAGDIILDNLNGNIFAKTVSGDIMAERDRGEVRLRTTTGDIKTTLLSGTLVAATTSGNIYSDFREVSVGVYLESSTGNIDLQLPKLAGYDIDARGLRFDFDDLSGDEFVKSVGFRDATVQIREGGIPVNLKTVAGSIRVRETQK